MSTGLSQGDPVKFKFQDFKSHDVKPKDNILKSIKTVLGGERDEFIVHGLIQKIVPNYSFIKLSDKSGEIPELPDIPDSIILIPNNILSSWADYVVRTHNPLSAGGKKKKYNKRKKSTKRKKKKYKKKKSKRYKSKRYKSKKRKSIKMSRH